MKRMIRGIHPSETTAAKLRLKMEITPRILGKTITDGEMCPPWGGDSLSCGLVGC